MTRRSILILATVAAWLVVLVVGFERGTTQVSFNQGAAAADAVAQNIKMAPLGSLSLVTEPDDGMAPVVSMIADAKQSIDLVMYELSDTDIEAALADAASRGVVVRVLLNEGYNGAATGEYGKSDPYNKPAYDYLKAHNVSVQWTPSYFALTHQKTLVEDGAKALIMTFNLTPQYYSTSRDFGVVDTDAADVAAIEAAFEEDWKGSRVTAPNGDDLVWSPGSEATLLALIASAKSSIDVYNEEMDDPAVTQALEAAAKRGVIVRVDMTYATNWKSAFSELTQAGVVVRTYASSSKKRYIHAKMILVDGSVAFLGSENFSAGSLDDNRELGLELNDPQIIALLQNTFESDWADAREYVAQ